MNNLFYILLAIVPFSLIGFLAFYSFKKKSQGKPIKRVLILNAALFIVLLVIASLLTFNVSAQDNTTDTGSQTTSQAAANDSKDNSKGLGLLAAAIVTAVSGLGGGIAVAAGAPAAIAATSEDPKVFAKALIFVALGEAIALYGVVISILILGKI